MNILSTSPQNHNTLVTKTNKVSQNPTLASTNNILSDNIEYFPNLGKISKKDLDNGNKFFQKPILEEIEDRRSILLDKKDNPKKYRNEWSNSMNSDLFEKLTKGFKEHSVFNNGSSLNFDKNGDKILYNFLTHRNKQGIDELERNKSILKKEAEKLGKKRHTIFQEHEKKMMQNMSNFFGTKVKFSDWFHARYGEKPKNNNRSSFKYYHTVPSSFRGRREDFEKNFHELYSKIIPNILQDTGISNPYLEIKTTSVVEKTVDTIVIHSNDPYIVFRIGEAMKVWGKQNGMYEKRPNHRTEYGLDAFKNKNGEITYKKENTRVSCSQAVAQYAMSNDLLAHINTEPKENEDYETYKQRIHKESIKLLEENSRPSTRNGILDRAMQIQFSVESNFYRLLQKRIEESQKK